MDIGEPKMMARINCRRWNDTAERTQFNMRMDPELKAAAEKAAADERRSLAGLIERMLEEYCRQYGYLKPERRSG